MKKILIFADYYLPGFKGGGPIKSLSLLCNEIKSNFEIYIVTKDRDLGDKEPYSEVMIDSWNNMNNVNIYYDSSNLSKNTIKKLIKEVDTDLIYLNSLFSRVSLKIIGIMKRQKISPQIILAPRGELMEGALSIKKTKKIGFLVLASIVGFYKDIIFHATSTDERESIKKFFRKNSITTIGNLSALNFKENRAEKIPGTLNLYFISRIAPKKNLHFALEILNELNKEIEINFRIIGPFEDKSYVDKCKNIIASFSSNINIVFEGAVHPMKINELIRQDSYFYFPTLGENYGHVIAESLLNSKPVIISDTTPWTKKVKEKNLGVIIPLNHKESWIRVLEELSAISNAEYQQTITNINQFQSEITIANNSRKELYIKLFNGHHDTR